MKKSRFGFNWGGSSTPTTTPAERRGEVNELKVALRDPAIERDLVRRREVMKRVLGFMTLGVDTAALFTEMIMACITKDLVQKKMIYLYLCAHSETNSEIAILCINTLQKDCKDESPLVRGLALRSLASLRLPQITEYLVPTLRERLVDTSPYVRKTSILATLKLFRASPETFRSMGLGEKMYGMLRDNDPLVAMNALAVLNEVLVDEGGINVTKQILYFLLNRMRDLSEWQQCAVLRLVLKYVPVNEDETFDIMNLLEERLRGSNSAVIVGCSRCFLHLTQNLPTVHQQVFARLKDPLLTLMATSQTYETSYPLLCHIKLLVQREPKVFQGNHKDFFIRHTDPTYVKAVKIDILTTIACDANSKDIVAELVEYVGDSTREISRIAIASIAKIALRVESISKQALQHFLDLLSMDVDHIRGTTLFAMKDFLRKYNNIDFVRPFLLSIVKSYKDMAFQDEESKVAFAWVLGEFGEHIEDAPYLLESMSALFTSESSDMRNEILAALMKLLFKRPPEVQPILGQVFQVAIADFSHADVHDRALLYYRMLRANPRAAAQIVCTPKAAVPVFAEDDISEVRDKLFEEFDTMSVVYWLPSSKYTRKAEDDDSDDDEADADEEPEEENQEGSLLATALELDDDAQLEPAAFQRLWAQLPVAATFAVRFKGAVPASSAVEDALADKSVFTLATNSGQGGTLKLYVFAKAAGGSDAPVYLMELVTPVNGSAPGGVTVKTAHADGGKKVQQLFAKALSQLATIA